MSSTGAQLNSPPERSKKHHSRAHLQKHLRSLQAEMTALRERVRVAESLYREASPGNASTSDTSSTRLFDSTFGRRPMDNFELRDFRNDVRTAQSSNDAMAESTGSAYSSSFSTYPDAPWRQHPYGATSQATSSASSISAIPGRRGTWRSGGGGNVLIFNTAGASEVESSRSANQRERTLSDDGDEEELGARGDDNAKRYQCLVAGCSKSFTTSGHARRHSRTHLGHKLFICPHEGCGSTFTRRDNCRQHQRARHPMTLPVSELTEGETIENLIFDRQQDQPPPSQ